MNKTKIIIDTDPGVDDATALIIALFSDKLDIKLITTTAGNVGIDKTTRNALYLLEKFNKKIPVSKGAKKPMLRKIHNASIVHGKDGLGKFVPTKPTIKPTKKNAVDALYDVIKQNAGEIVLVELAPHTNLGYLFKKYPDCENMIKHIIFEGGSPYGKENVKPHISFNISFDPEAANIVMNTNIPKTIIPSELGRYVTPFSKEQVEIIKNTNETGKFLVTMFDGYVNRYGLNITQTNDLCAIIYLLYPEIFQTYKCDILVNTTNHPGKTIITENENGKVDFVEHADNTKFFEVFIENLKKIG